MQLSCRFLHKLYDFLDWCEIYMLRQCLAELVNWIHSDDIKKLSFLGSWLPKPCATFKNFELLLFYLYSSENITRNKHMCMALNLEAA